MTPVVSNTISYRKAFWQHRFVYTFTATMISFLLYTGLYMIGMVPSQLRYHPETNTQNRAISTAQATTSVDKLSTVAPSQEAPERIVIDKVGIDTVVKNPISTDLDTLDSYLAEGAVRWPTSGHPGEGNLFVFGHSSSLETVWNQAYKTFNGIGELQEGDEIRVQTASGTYIYTVVSVQFKEDAAIYVPFNTGDDMLTLSTCNNLGSKEDRIVVQALFTEYISN